MTNVGDALIAGFAGLQPVSWLALRRAEVLVLLVIRTRRIATPTADALALNDAVAPCLLCVCRAINAAMERPQHLRRSRDARTQHLVGHGV